MCTGGLARLASWTRHCDYMNGLRSCQAGFLLLMAAARAILVTVALGIDHGVKRLARSWSCNTIRLALWTKQGADKDCEAN